MNLFSACSRYSGHFVLVAGLILLASCSDTSVSNDEQENSVVVSELTRESLHYWRVRALSDDASGNWSEPSYFRIVDDSGVSSGDAGSETNAAMPIAYRLLNDESVNEATLPQAVVDSTGVYEGTVPPTPTWNTVRSAIAYEVEIVDIGADQLKANVLFDGQAVCSDIGCAAPLVEVEAVENEPPSALIEQLEIDPLQAELLKFTADGSSDPDGVIAKYSWRVDGRYIGTPTGVAFEYKFDEYGTYRVGLEVTDNVGAVDLKFIDVEVGFVGMPAEISTENAEIVATEPLPTAEEASASSNTTSAEAGTQDVPEPPLAGALEQVAETAEAQAESQPLPEAEAQAQAGTQNEAVSQTDTERQATQNPITTEPSASWQLAGIANTTLTVGNILFVGGDFTEIYNNDGETLQRSYLAALDRYTGEPLSFAPVLDDEVWALALSPDENTLYVGGGFLTADGQTRKRVAAYNVRTGALTNFNPPAPNSALRAIAADNDRVYLGGLFTNIGGEDLPYLAAVNSATGELDQGFVASPNDRVKAIVIHSNSVWIGGDFTRINGNLQKSVGAVDRADGSLQSTDGVSYPVIALAASNTQLFIAGGGPGGRAAAFDLSTGIEQWEISSDGNFQAVDVDDGRFVYFGGHYEAIEGNTRIDRLTRHSKATGETDLSWLPQINGIRSINAVDVTPDGLHIGGDFTRVDNKPHEGLAILPGTTD